MPYRVKNNRPLDEIRQEATDHALDILGFGRIKEEIADNAITDKARNKILNIHFLENISDIRYSMAFVQDLRILLERDSYPLDGLHDIKDEVILSRKDGVLEPRALWKIMRVCRLTSKLIKLATHGAKDLLTIAPFLSGLEQVAEIPEQVQRFLEPPGELREDASPMIVKLNKEIKRVHDKIQSRMEKLLTDSRYDGMFQDELITIRNDRFVVPVKVEMGGRFDGVVHDRSGTGQTLFMEPLAVIGDNNELKNMKLQIENEKKRILSSLTELVRRNATAILHNLELLFVMDYYNSIASFAERYECEIPKVIDISEKNSKRDFVFVNAYNPILLLELEKDDIVPLNFQMTNDIHGFMITGPNMGGKTVSLKTSGLITAMALCGMPVPASKETRIPSVRYFFADIGDEQSIEFSLSSFAAHVRRWDEAARGANKYSLVLLDELGASTDPVEGVPLVRALMERILDNESYMIVTTHLSELLPFAEDRNDLENCSMAFDEEKLESTYRFRQGLPERSFAIPVANRLGLLSDIVKRARGLARGENMRLDKLLRNISSKLSSIEQKESELLDKIKINDEEKLKLQKLIDKEKDLTKELANTKERVEREANQKLEIELLKHKEEINQAIDEIKKKIKEAEYTPTPRAIDDPRIKELRRLRQDVTQKSKEYGKKLVMKKGKPKDITEGSRVYIKRLHKEGFATSDTDDHGYVKVSVGTMTLKVHSSSVTILEDPSVEKDNSVQAIVYSTPEVETRKDVRGNIFDEAWQILEPWIGDAYRANHERLIIVHGKGTGILGKKIQQALLKNKFVKKYSYAEGNEGGMGATVVELKK